MDGEANQDGVIHIVTSEFFRQTKGQGAERHPRLERQLHHREEVGVPQAGGLKHR